MAEAAIEGIGTCAARAAGRVLGPAALLLMAACAKAPEALPIVVAYDHTAAPQRVEIPLRLTREQSVTFEFHYRHDSDDRASRDSAAALAGLPGMKKAPTSGCAATGETPGVSIPVRLTLLSDDETVVDTTESCTQRTYRWGGAVISRRIFETVLPPGRYTVVIEQSLASPLPATQRVDLAVVESFHGK